MPASFEESSRYTDAEIAALRAQKKRASETAKAEIERRGGQPVNPRILAARAIGKNV